MISEKSYISNETKFNINKNYSLGFSTNKNLDQNLTEYYDIIYEYKNDCLTAALEYKKTFYRDSDIEPAENLFFSIKIIPFGDINSPSSIKNDYIKSNFSFNTHSVFLKIHFLKM